MLDYVIQIPLSMPCPGWEHYYKPYDGSLLQSEANIQSGTSSQSLDRTTNGKTNFKIPAWALDVDGYCCFIKEISKD